MAGDQGTVTAAAAVTAGELVPRAGARPPGPAVIAAELLARTRAELPVLAGLGEREELLAAAWLASLRAPRTRRAYAGDVRGWLEWLGRRGTDVLGAGRVHVDLWVAGRARPRGGGLHRAASAVGAAATRRAPWSRRPRADGDRRPLAQPVADLHRQRARPLTGVLGSDRRSDQRIRLQPGGRMHAHDIPDSAAGSRGNNGRRQDHGPRHDPNRAR